MIFNNTCFVGETGACDTVISHRLHYDGNRTHKWACMSISDEMTLSHGIGGVPDAASPNLNMRKALWTARAMTGSFLEAVICLSPLFFSCVALFSLPLLYPVFTAGMPKRAGTNRKRELESSPPPSNQQRVDAQEWLHAPDAAAADFDSPPPRPTRRLKRRALPRKEESDEEGEDGTSAPR